MLARTLIAALLTALIWSVASVAQPVGSYTMQPPASAPTGNSLIFTAASSQFLSKTGNTSASKTTLTVGGWVKLSSATLSTSATFYLAGDGTSNNFVLMSLNSGSVLLDIFVSGSEIGKLHIPSASIADTNWHNILYAIDTTQATSTNRLKAYLDGTLLSYSTTTFPTQNANLSTALADAYYFGNVFSNLGTTYFDGKMAQIYCIDGQQLTPTSFITGTPGMPKTYSGTYTGHFDFFLPFSNGTSTTTLGADSSGESNNWTLNAMTTANQSSDYP